MPDMEMAGNLAALVAAATLVFGCLRYLKCRRTPSAKPETSAVVPESKPTHPQSNLVSQPAPVGSDHFWPLAWIVPTVGLLAMMTVHAGRHSSNWWIVAGCATLMLLIAYLVLILNETSGTAAANTETGALAESPAEDAPVTAVAEAESSEARSARSARSGIRSRE